MHVRYELFQESPYSCRCVSEYAVLVCAHPSHPRLTGFDGSIPIVSPRPLQPNTMSDYSTCAEREEEGETVELGTGWEKRRSQRGKEARERERWGPYLWRDGAGNGGWRNHLAEKGKKREAIRKLKGPGVESGYLEPDWKHSAVSRLHPRLPQAPSMEELTKEEKEEAAAVNSLFRWSLAKRDFNMKSTGYQ